MYSSKRPLMRSLIFVFILASLFIVACGPRVGNENWPGLSTDGEKIYLANGPGVAAYNVESQELAWTYPAETNPSLQFYAAPSVQEDRVIFGDYGAAGGFFSPTVKVTMYGVEDSDNGATAPTIWTNNELAKDKIVAPALQVGDVAYVGTADKFMIAIHANTGEEIWTFETGHSVWGKPAYRDGVLFVNSMDRAIHALDAETGEELWVTSFDGALAAGPVLNENLVYLSSFDSNVHALDTETGEIKWSASGENWVWGAPAYADGTVYFADIEGNIYAVDAQTGEQLWENQTEGAVQTSPVVAGDVVYIASEGASSEIPIGALRAFSTTDGTILWTSPAPAPIFTTPVVVGDAVIVALPLSEENALLIAFNAETGTQLWSINPPAES